MQVIERKILKCIADEGKVFDYKVPRFEKDEEGNEIQIHAYAKELYLSPFDSIDNYIEVPAPVEE